MKQWTVEVLDHRVEKELDDLPTDLRARLARIVELIEAVGLPNVREPHVKHLDGKLWELRVKGRDGIARAIYVTTRGRRVVILHAFQKKSQKTPRSTLRLAKNREREIDL